MKFALDLADSINSLADEIDSLRRENAHLQALLAIYQRSTEASDKHSKEMIGMVFTALVDPESGFNKKERVLAKARIAGIEP